MERGQKRQKINIEPDAEMNFLEGYSLQREAIKDFLKDVVEERK